MKRETQLPIRADVAERLFARAQAEVAMLVAAARVDTERAIEWHERKRPS